jgi:hypothetical protein
MVDPNGDLGCEIQHREFTGFFLLTEAHPKVIESLLTS